MPTHYQGCETSVRALNAYINLVRASDSVMDKLAADIESHGLTLGQFAVLEAVYHLGPMCQKTVAKKLLRSGGNITLVVNNLEKQGLVRRERQANDRRMVQIHLTVEGRERISRVFPKHVEAIVKVMSALSDSEQEELRRICRKLGKGGEELCEERRKREAEHAANQTE
ncbi:MAG TPA: MarR family transcriptional regulator [Candidatus Acidoferrum sp.]|nr:MarR family transcriptional regulator [Candidatus Acidoferrum sp.]